MPVSTEFGRDDTFTVADGLEVTPVPDGAMIYQSATDQVHYLNPTATIIFELCGMGKSVAEIERFITDGFALPEPPVQHVTACLTSLSAQQLIAVRR